jgi:RNA polymerase sigma-70 factor, ECF subfamily
VRLQLVTPTSPELEQAVREHGDLLRALARRLCRDATEAEDLVQDTIERALRNSASFKSGTNARAWLVSILNHLFIDRCRVRSREGAAVQLDDVQQHLPAPVPDLEPKWAQLGKEDVDRAVTRLDAPFRDVYRLHTDGRSYDQIAQQLDVPRATVATRLMRARKKLKTLLFGDVEEEGSA